MKRIRSIDLSVGGWIGLVMVLLALGVALFGPFFAPYPPDAIFGAAFAKPSSQHLLGLDFVGRDALSRFLWGGRTAIFIALLGTVFGAVVGILLGIASAYRRGWFDELFGRFTDLMLAFPALIFALLLLAAFGSSVPVVVVALAITTAPGVMRIARAAALEVVDLPYVEAARARGERIHYVLGREILPNIRRPVLVDFGLRLTASILLVAALSFLGLGLKPPAADWGLMIGENRVALTVQPWPVVVPIVAIAFITIGINLLLDGYRRRMGTWRVRERTETTSAV
ncbi:MAG TPA: ABC transporter permease [Gaiellaceae bacterium]|jgi:peptide/nickel transport system permease protein